VPFTDPLADGPTIQKANQRALKGGTKSVRQCLELAVAARKVRRNTAHKLLLRYTITVTCNTLTINL
jgi:tryptophan synthase alpha subunit